MAAESRPARTSRGRRRLLVASGLGLLTGIALGLAATPAEAYIGPGAGFAFVGATLVLLSTLALVVVILGGSGSLVGSLVGSFVVGFLYNFGQAMFPELAYVVLFLPMLIVLVLRPQGLFGRPPA